MDPRNPFLPQIAQNQPGLFDALHGGRGSAHGMSYGMFSGMQHLSMGGGWNNPWLGQQAGTMAGQVFGQLYNNPWIDMHGQGGARMGQVFGELARRGMNTGMQFGVPGVAANLHAWSGAMSAAQNAFGAMGNNNPGTGQMMDYLNGMTGGAMHTMSPGVVELLARRGMNLGAAAGMNPAQAMNMVGMGAQLGQSVGLDSTIGAQIGMSSMAFGQAFGRGAGFQGFGGLSKDMAVLQDMRLRTAAGKSPMANMMGAMIAMSQSGLFKNNDNLQGMADRLKLGDTSDFEGMKPGELLSKLKAGGISGNVAMQFLNSKEANQEQIAQFGLQDKVRAMQGSEVGGMIERQLQSGMLGAIRDPKAARAAAKQLHDQLKAIGEDPESRGLLTDPNRMGDLVDRLAQNIDIEAPGLDQDKKKAMIAASVRGLQNAALKKDGQLGGFGNLAGLFAMNRSDILANASDEVTAADMKGMAQNAVAAVGVGGLLSRASDAVQQIGEGGAVAGALAGIFGGVQKMDAPPKAPDGQGGANNQGQVKVVGTLTLKADGNVNLDGNSSDGVAAIV